MNPTITFQYCEEKLEQEFDKQFDYLPILTYLSNYENQMEIKE